MTCYLFGFTILEPYYAHYSHPIPEYFVRWYLGMAKYTQILWVYAKIFTNGAYNYR